MQISLMSARHLPQIMAVELLAYPWPWTEGMFLDSLRNGHLCYVGTENDQVMAYCVAYVAVRECHILNICVDPSQQGKGHGISLLNYSLQAAKDMDADAAFLEVRPSNHAAVALYEKRGFKQVGVRKDYYPAGDIKEDALVYRLDI